MIVDMEHHFILADDARAKGVERTWSDGKLLFFPPTSGASIEKHLWFMDEAGIDMAVMIGQLFNKSIEQVRRWNDACAKVLKEHPTRFFGFTGSIPLGGQQAFDELDRAINELGMKGVQIGTRIEGKTLDDRALWPFYHKVSQLGVPIDVHICASPPGFDALHAPWGLYYVMAREFDITATVFRLCFGGVLEEFPDLTFIVNHFGGGVVAMKDRMDLYVQLCGDAFYEKEPMISRPWNEYFDKLYFNMAGRGAAISTVKCALAQISPRRLMFGTDWPPNYEFDPESCKGFIRDIQNLDLPADDIEAMLAGNAASLLGLPGPLSP